MHPARPWSRLRFHRIFLCFRRGWTGVTPYLAEVGQVEYLATISGERTCRGWQQEGIYRLLCNVLSPEVAEDPDEFIVYGGGRAVRDRIALDMLLKILRDLRDDETVLVQSGKPVAVFRTHPLAPRVLMSTAMMVPQWSDWGTFRALEQKGLTMYGQSTAASWSYIGAQGILQNTFETLWDAASRWFEGSLQGRLVLTSGLGGMGCAQPLAVEMNGGVALVVEPDAEKVMKRLQTRHVQVATDDVDEACRMVREAVKLRLSRTVALIGNAGEVYPQLAAKGLCPDIVTDQTSAHDLLNGYLPAGMTVDEARQLRVADPVEYTRRAEATLVRHVRAMLDFQSMGAVVFEYGNHLRAQAVQAGVAEAEHIPSFITLFARERLAQGATPLRWIALSADPEDIFTVDDWLANEFPHDDRLMTWLRWARERVHFQGLPARSAWLTAEQRTSLVEVLSEWVRRGTLTAPVAVTRDHFAGATMASPHRETEALPDGSDAIADWPVLNGLLLASMGATLVSIQQGGGVGIGYSMHTGTVVVLDGDATRQVLAQQALHAELELGILRYADAGEPGAEERARSLASSPDVWLRRSDSHG